MAFTVSEVAQWIGATVVNAEDLGEQKLSAIRVERGAAIEEARRSTDLTFFFSKAYQRHLLEISPGILITGDVFVKPLKEAGLPFWGTTAVLSCADPYWAMAVVSEKLASRLSTGAHLEPPSQTKIHPSAVVHESAEVSSRVWLGPSCVVEEGAKIGDGCVLYAGCYVGAGVKIGSGTVLFPRVTLYERVEVGSHVRIHAGAVIGADGFGYAPRGGEAGVSGHQKIYHLGRVIIGDDVEIGANACVDRGTFGDTVIESEVKIDNQVQIGHNVKLGRGTVVCGSAAFAGSSSTGEFVYVGGLTGVTNGVHIGDRARVGALSLVTKDIPPGGTAVGNPQREYREHFKVNAWLNRRSQKLFRTEKFDAIGARRGSGQDGQKSKTGDEK